MGVLGADLGRLPGMAGPIPLIHGLALFSAAMIEPDIKRDRVGPTPKVSTFN